jgi:hypothetical protein
MRQGRKLWLALLSGFIAVLMLLPATGYFADSTR